jgi:hypothetical protein
MSDLWCVTNDLPEVRSCTILGEHRVTCSDAACRGCAPIDAHLGYVCVRCFDAIVHELSTWDEFKGLVAAAGGRMVAAEPGASTPTGYSHLSLAVLAIDECERWLASVRGVTVDVWVGSWEGARDAVMFARAAASARRSLPTEDRPVELVRRPCPHCDALVVFMNRTREVGGWTVVECENCGEVLDEIRQEVDRWVGSEPCETHSHGDCERFNCGCPCHVEYPFDGDAHTAGRARREEWSTEGRTDRERTAA